MRAIIILLGLVAAALAVPVSYEGYKVYRVTPKTNAHAQILKIFEKDVNFDFWSPLRGLNQPIDVMVPPGYQKMFGHLMAFHKFESSVLIENVEKVFKEERERRALSPKVPQGKISFTSYHRYSEIQEYLSTVAAAHPDIATVSSIGKSYEGRDISMIKISTGGSGKPTILVDAGIHAREWIAPATALYMIQELVENTANRELIENIDWMIIPVLNPDGYEFTFDSDRLWRKTRSIGQFCTGVDPNRNFEFHWMETGASDYECSDIYAGPTPFSEPETSALRDLVLANVDSIKLYLTFHSYGQYLLYPWGYTSQLPDDWQELHAVAEDVDDAIASMDGTRYIIGSSTNVLYSAAGGSDDWCKGVGGIALSYTIELPGGGVWGFDLPPERIDPVVKETWLGVVVYHNYVRDKFVGQ